MYIPVRNLTFFFTFFPIPVLYFFSYYGTGKGRKINEAASQIENLSHKYVSLYSLFNQ